MKQKFWGILVMILLGVALIIASIIIFIHSIAGGIIYLGLCFLAAAVIVYAFCAKCVWKENCPHVMPGKTALLFKRKIDRYTKIELTIVTISFLLIVGVPQFWLRFHLISLLSFWMLIITSVILIPLTLCSACNNKLCPFKK